MSFQVNVDRQNQIVFTTIGGKIDLRQLKDCLSETAMSARIDGYRELCDISGIEDFEMPSSEISDIAAVAADLPFGKGTKIAILAATPLQTGMANMYIRFREMKKSPPSRPARLFHDKAEALEWLGIRVEH